MWFVLCAPGDTAALWAADGLRRRGLAPVEVVPLATLASALRWEHRIDADGVLTSVRLADGRRLESAAVRGVLNRVAWTPTDLVDRAAPADRDYAVQEVHAFFLSWLHALPRVLNPPTPRGLAGAWRSAAEWHVLAAAAGLRNAPVRVGTGAAAPDGTAAEPARTVCVAAGRVCGPRLPPEVEKGCAALSRLADTPLLGIDFVAAEPGEWTFAAATPFPALQHGGEPLCDALADFLAREPA